MEEGYINHVYYKITGEGTPLVLIAGLGADHLTWEPLIKHLNGRFQIILFDNRGIGKSSIPDDGECSIEKMANDVLMLLKHLDIKNAHIAGHSLGGYIAQEFASKNPEITKKLVLISSKTKSQPVQKLYIQNTQDMMKQNVSRELIIKNSFSWLFSNTYLSNPEIINDSIVAAM